MFTSRYAFLILTSPFFSHNSPIISGYLSGTQKNLQHSIDISGFFPFCVTPFCFYIPCLLFGHYCLRTFLLFLTTKCLVVLSFQIATVFPFYRFCCSLTVASGWLRERKGEIGFFNTVWTHRETQRSEGARCIHLWLSAWQVSPPVLQDPPEPLSCLHQTLCFWSLPQEAHS